VGVAGKETGPMRPLGIEESVFERKVKVQQRELAAGMLVKHGRAWVRIHHIEHPTAGSNQRKATCTLRDQVRPGGFTVWFAAGEHKVVASTLPLDFAIKPSPAPVKREHVQGGVHNVVNGEVNGPLIQAGSIDGQTVTDFFKDK